MAIVSQMTLTYMADGLSTWEPSSATGIYSNGSIKFVNNDPVLLACQFYLEDADGHTISDWRNGEGLIENTGTVTKTLSELFPGRTLAGYYLFQSYNDPTRLLIYDQYTACGAPTSPKVSATLSRGAVTLSWGAGSAGTNNSVTGYDVQQRESTDGSSWGSWATVSGSPVTGTSLSVSPPDTVGSYYQYRVRTRGSAGSGYYSGWVTSTNKLRRKWDAFGAWTDATLTARVTPIRAVHLTQIQERIATIRSFYGLSVYTFTAITARQTKIAKWETLIGELRSAIDGITTNHESWNTLEAGKPRIAHITQLRSIIDNM